jgi:hypothetical protein
VGLARLMPSSVVDTVMQHHMMSNTGTFCSRSKSDLYSLDIMLLQIIMAKPPMGLTHHVGCTLENDAILDMLTQLCLTGPLRRRSASPRWH